MCLTPCWLPWGLDLGPRAWGLGSQIRVEAVCIIYKQMMSRSLLEEELAKGPSERGTKRATPEADNGQRGQG